MSTTWNTTEPYPEAGDVGGDWQHGPARNVRWWRELDARAGAFEVVEVNVYLETADVRDGDPGRYIVTEQTARIICGDPEDPGSTEETSDYTYTSTSADYPLADAETHREERYQTLATRKDPE